MFKTKIKVWHHVFDMKTMSPVTKYHEKAIEIPDDLLPLDFSSRIMDCTIRNDRSLEDEFRTEFQYGMKTELRDFIVEALGEQLYLGCSRCLLEIIDGIYLSLSDNFGKLHKTLCYDKDLAAL